MKLSLSIVAVTALTGSLLAQDISPSLRRQLDAVRSEKLARTPGQRKLTSQLHYLSQETAGRSAVAGVPDLKSRVERELDGRVIVDISAPPSTALKQAITALGGTVLYESRRWQSVRATVPPAALNGLAARPDVKRIAKGTKPTAHTGVFVNEADAAHKAGLVRTNYGVNGSGIKVGVISNSSDHSSNSVANGELPLFTVLPNRSGSPASGEGTAMAEIVADIAPGAQIYFASASGGKAAFADSILLLRSNGCQVIVDDISYGDEWQFQDDEIGQAVNSVVADGALYLSSSGNEGSLVRSNSTTWEGDFVDGGTSALLPAGRVHRFGAQTYNRLTDGDSSATLQWSDEYHSSTNDYDLHILSADGASIVASSTDTQNGDGPPYESVETVHPGERIIIWKDDGAADRYLRLACTRSTLETATAGQTIGHAATANCLCVASSDATINLDGFTTASVLDDASSDGPHKMFYHPDGTPITPGNFLSSGGRTIPSPALTAGDGGATSVPGFEAFYGTSAAAPAAAAIAALVWSQKPSLTGTQVRGILEGSCLDIEAPGFDINSGHGILMADRALAKVSPTNLVAVAIGPDLSLSWPEPHTGWRLIASTNQLAADISTNLNDWATVSGSTATNQITLRIDPARQATFFRLAYP